MNTWRDFAEKKANWLTDALIVSPLTALYRKQNAAYKAEQASSKDQAAARNTARQPGAAAAGRKDALVGLAQSVSNSYRSGSLARPKTYNGGRAVAR